jgi:hypothetical protein
LNGATSIPRRAINRANAVVSKLLPAQLEVPWIISAFAIAPPIIA